MTTGAWMARGRLRGTALGRLMNRHRHRIAKVATLGPAELGGFAVDLVIARGSHVEARQLSCWIKSNSGASATTDMLEEIAAGKALRVVKASLPSRAGITELVSATLSELAGVEELTEGEAWP